MTRGRRGGSEPRVGPVAADRRLEIRLTSAQHAEWSALATAHGMNLAELVRAAVEMFGIADGDQLQLAELGREVLASVRKRFPAKG